VDQAGRVAVIRREKRNLRPDGNVLFDRQGFNSGREIAGDSNTFLDPAIARSSGSPSSGKRTSLIGMRALLHLNITA